MKKLSLITTCIVGVVLVFSCSNNDNVTDPGQPAPVINSLLASQDSLQRGQSIDITCDAVDPQGRQLTYFWAASGGSITGTGNRITWTAPDTEGMYSITCNVENDQGAEVSEKADVYVIKPNVPEQGLIAYYPFINATDDESNNQYDGSLLGGASANDILTIGTNASDALSLPNQILDGLSDFTISGWLRMGRTGDAYDNFWISVSDGTNHNFIMFYYDNSDNRWELSIDRTSYYFDSDIQMKDLKWHHVVLMRSGALARLYIDGNEIGSGISVKTYTLDVVNNGLIIGQDQDAVGSNFQEVQSWAGDIDNLYFYSRALSTTEVQQLLNDPHSGN